jgi:hypothetical protein
MSDIRRRVLRKALEFSIEGSVPGKGWMTTVSGDLWKMLYIQGIHDILAIFVRVD